MNIFLKIQAAVAAGTVTLAHVQNGSEWTNMAEWLEFSSEIEQKDAMIAAGLLSDKAGDIYEINAEMARQRARYASIKGA